MGKATRAKQAKQEEAAQKVASVLLTHSAQKRPSDNGFDVCSMLNQVSDYMGKAIRSFDSFSYKAKTDNPNKKLLALVKHLFGPYRVPRIFEKAWDLKFVESRTDWGRATGSGTYQSTDDKQYRPWYITIATGGSLFKTHTKGMLTKQETHILQTCPHQDLTITEAIFYAVCKATGCDTGVALKIARSKISRMAAGVGSARFEFWANCCRFFATQPDISKLTIQQVGDFTDYLNHCRNQDHEFTLFGKGYTITTLQKRMTDWHYALRRAKMLDGSWEGHAIPDFEYETKDNLGNDEVWTLKQIKKGTELAEEGTAQHHCVASYRSSCSNGMVSIWSLRCNGKRKVTVELHNRGAVIQARGYANRRAKPEELNVIGRWCNENGLRIDYT